MSNACSKTRPLSGRGTAMIEMPREGSTLASVRQTTVSRSAPCPFHPVAADIHCFRPEMTHESPNRRAVVRTPSPGGRDSDVGAAAGFGRSECGKRCTLGRKKGRQKPLVLLWFAANHQRRKPEHRGEHGE